MRRLALTVALFGVLAPPAHAAAPASVDLTRCAPRDRAAEFEASMDAVEGAAKMKMRFTLQARKPGRRTFRRVAAPGFSAWTTADPGTTSYTFTRRVEALVGPARYRAMVRFVWLGADGQTVARARRYSHACRQPDHRANLKVKALSLEGRHDYVALVANTGATETGPFELQVEVGDQLLEPVPIESLEPHEQRLVTVRGPQYAPGAEMTATADPADTVDERNEDDNAFTATCA
jgi:CARDB protein